MNQKSAERNIYIIFVQCMRHKYRISPGKSGTANAWTKNQHIPFDRLLGVKGENIRYMAASAPNKLYSWGKEYRPLACKVKKMASVYPGEARNGNESISADLV